MIRDEEQQPITGKQNQTENQQQEPLIDLSLISRLGFIKKVYSILLFQLTITTIFTCISLSNDSIREFQAQNFLLLILTCIFSIVFLCALFCYGISRKVPTNYIVLILFTLCESYAVSAYCCVVATQYSNGTNLIIMALIMTVCMTFALTAYAFTTKEDLTFCLPFMWVIGCCLFLFGIFLIFTNNPVIHIVYCIFAIIFYSIYLIIDTQLIIGGKRYQISMDDYILGSVILYIDIIMLFLELLKLLALLFGKH